MSAPTPVWYFDLISPFVHLQLELQEALFERLRPVCRPVLFGVILQQQGTLGPAEIAHKRTFTYRHVLWRAQQAGLTMNFPPEHPFRSLHLQRLCVGLETDWRTVRECSRFVWQDGRLPGTQEDWRDLAALRRWDLEQLEQHLQNPEVKRTLMANNQEALAHGVFGVPTFRIGSELFWGEDSSAMLQGYLDTPGLFEQEAFRRLEALPVGIVRRPAAE